MIGRTISHYQITEKLGAGGMGEVYLATDTRLGRPVALKFLPDSVRHNADARERLLREARAASKLNHPNILTVYAIEEADGRDFIVMEFVPGKPLNDFVRDRANSLDQILTLAIQIGEGLAKAHQSGIVHRDLKPANIQIDADGRARLLDFGVARIAGEARLTQTGSTVGTVAYASPEQVQGGDADHRSDIFSFGVLLYEMITGRLPFSGDHEAAIIYAIVHETPEPLARHKPGLPDALQTVVSKCLAKRPEERYRSVGDLVSDLKAITKPAPSIESRGQAPKKKMLAVLPFENLGPTEEEYFADGMTEEIISRLAAVRDLGVISRTSAMQYKGTRKPIRQIAGELGVDYVLEGTVRWSKNPAGPSRVRITPQLIQVDDDTHLWSDRYDRVIEDIFAIQSEIAEQVIHQLNVTLRGPEREVVCAQCTSNVEAYQAYLRGLEYARHPDYQDDKYRSAIRLFEHAVSLDPEFAAAYAELSLAHSALYFFGFDRTAERLARSKSSADRALGLQPDLADARSALGFYLYRGHRDWEGALEQFQIAFRGKPNDSRILFTTGGIRRRQGRFAEARDNLMRAFPLDPRDARLPLEIGVTCLLMRQFEEAERFFDQSIALAPDQTNAYTWKSMLYLGWRGDLNAARHALESVLQPDVDATFAEWFLLRLCERDFQGTLVWLDRTGLDQHEAQAFFWSIAQLRGWLYDLLGDRTQAMAAYELARVSLEARREAQPDDFRVYSSLGSVYAGLGRPEEAVAAARRATELVPVTVDAVIGPFCLESLAHTCIRIGETELALDLLERLLAMPSLLSVSMLKIDPFLDPLRDYPRFHKLLAQPDKVF